MKNNERVDKVLTEIWHNEITRVRQENPQKLIYCGYITCDTTFGIAKTATELFADSLLRTEEVSENDFETVNEFISTEENRMIYGWVAIVDPNKENESRKNIFSMWNEQLFTFTEKFSETEYDIEQVKQIYNIKNPAYEIIKDNIVSAGEGCIEHNVGENVKAISIDITQGNHRLVADLFAARRN